MNITLTLSRRAAKNVHSFNDHSTSSKRLCLIPSLNNNEEKANFHILIERGWRWKTMCGIYSKEESISWPFSWPFMILEAFFSSLERERGAHKAPSCTQGTTSHFLFAIQRDLKQKGSWRVKKCTHTQCISTNRWGSSATCFLRKFWLIGVQFFLASFRAGGTTVPISPFACIIILAIIQKVQ